MGYRSKKERRNNEGFRLKPIWGRQRFIKQDTKALTMKEKKMIWTTLKLTITGNRKKINLKRVKIKFS